MVKHYGTGLAVCATLLSLVGCTNDSGPVAPQLDDALADVRAVLSCRVDVKEGSLDCNPEFPETSAGVSGAVVGGQGRYIYLQASHVSYDEGTEVFSANVTVHNFLTQTLGTEDGATVHGEGVRVFFHQLPTVTKSNGPGEVTVKAADGIGTFTNADQPYYQYSQVLSPGKVSLPRTWQFDVPATVEEFTFSVYVSAKVVNEDSILHGPRIRAQRIAPGGSHTCALTMAEERYCWGRNNYGQLGLGQLADTIYPVKASNPGGVPFASISAGYEHTCGITVEGKVYCWGRNNYGQVGDSVAAAQYRASPRAIKSNAVFTALSSGSDHTCGVTTEGKVYCWGRGTYGTLGDGGTTNRSYPVQVIDTSNSTFVAVSAGSEHTCALTDTGKIYCWGRNSNGQLGGEYDEDKTQAVPIADTTNSTFVAIGAGDKHNCALTDTGKILCWGSNDWSQMGDGDGAPTSHAYPIPVADTSNSTWVALATGNSHNCAINTAGKVYCWGYNQMGQLGVGAQTVRRQPVPISAPSGVVFVTVAASLLNHTCAISSTGIAYCWGSNSRGKVGSGSGDTYILTPAVVAQVTNFAYLDPRQAAGDAPTPFPRRSFEAYALAARLTPQRVGTI